MSRELWGYVIWGSLFLLWAIPEVIAAAFSKRVPFPTLSETVGDLIRLTNGWAAIAIVGGFAILLIHWIMPDTFNPNKKHVDPDLEALKKELEQMKEDDG